MDKNKAWEALVQVGARRFDALLERYHDDWTASWEENECLRGKITKFVVSRVSKRGSSTAEKRREVVKGSIELYLSRREFLLKVRREVERDHGLVWQIPEPEEP